MRDITQALARAEKLTGRVMATEKQILESAEARLSTVNRRLDSIRAASVTVPGVDRQYEELVSERGRLNQVIARAQRNLATW